MTAGRLSATPPLSARDRAIRGAADALVDAVAERASRTPREAAEAAFYPGHPLGSVEAIEAEIIRRRVLDAGSAACSDRAA
ncbi:hypothetical protein [Streptomyces sp. NPDC086182]|uniref:hypothetical protein n=1 Tax=Streptomyces sp. NPDC086182 TaxID=3155058 RepID=UPI00342B3714